MWSEQPDGSIVGGAMYLDRGFDRDDNRRRLLRIHELGHALGYQHVESRTSIMNPSIGPEPTEFDRAGAIIAFARPVGNKSPDVDPASTALSASTGAGRWVAPTTACALPIQCRVRASRCVRLRARIHVRYGRCASVLRQTTLTMVEPTN